MELWIKFNGLPARFGLKEFAIMTGLSCHEYPSDLYLEDVKEKGKAMMDILIEKNGGKRAVSGGELLNIIEQSDLDTRTKYRLSLAWFAHSILCSKDLRTGVDPLFVCLASRPTTFFTKYPWGRKSFEMTIQNLVAPMTVGKKGYNLYGFPWAFVAWAYEAIPSLRHPGHDVEYYTIEWSSRWSQVHSVIFHSDCSLYDNMSHFFHSFKFLKVLVLERTRVDSFPTDLVYLSYFAARVLELSILSSITNCWNLETLLLDNIGRWGTLPITVWEMVKVRNLHVGSFTIENEKGLVENSNKLHDLTTLSKPIFHSVQDAELILRKTPNLRELKFGVHYIPEFENCVLNFPTQIEKLKIQRVRGNDFYFPFRISAPNLTNLTLEHFGLDPLQLSEIGLLQNLQVLKLRCIFFKKGWEVRNEEFPLLKVLKLDEVRFGVKTKWAVADEAFPNLERLVLIEMLSFCLKEIPSRFRGKEL